CGGADLACARLADEAERWLDKPVVSMATALLWHTQRQLHRSDRWFRLLAQGTLARRPAGDRPSWPCRAQHQGRGRRPSCQTAPDQQRAAKAAPPKNRLPSSATRPIDTGNGDPDLAPNPVRTSTDSELFEESVGSLPGTGVVQTAARSQA